jgi:oligoribonuclease NrnB/cAMP/cGMP phosphodiesterase (DHH superfamily)
MNLLTKKIKHISHNDLDGYACTLLTEFIIETYPENIFKLETQNIVPNQLYGVIKKTLNEIGHYDLIIITDLAMRQEVVDIIQHSGYSDKFLIIDHHQTTVDIKKYQWLNISTHRKDSSGKDTDKLTCATKLYYEFLLKDSVFDINLLRLSSTTAIDFFIECVTAHDTKSYDGYEDMHVRDHIKDISSRLNSLLHIIDRSEFKSYIKDYITNENFSTEEKSSDIPDVNNDKKYNYSSEEALPNFLYLTRSIEKYPWLDKILEIESIRNKRYIDNAIKRMNVITLNRNIFKDGKITLVNYVVGLIFAEKLNSDISEGACEKRKDIDFCAIVNNNQVSFYTSKEDINVGELAALLGGGGHKKAAGFTISMNDSNWFNKNHFLAMFNSAGNIAIPTI